MTLADLIRIPEPSLLFRHGQAVEDPRDGLTLFGPLDRGATYGIRYGIIGTTRGIQSLKGWVERLQNSVACKKGLLARPPFPGFEAAFLVPWEPSPLLELTVNEADLQKALYQEDRHQRVYGVVDLYAKLLIRAHLEEEAKPDVWFVVVPDEVRTYCRPQASVEVALRIPAEFKLSKAYAAELLEAPSLFAEDNLAAKPYQFEPHFHNQLKAKLLKYQMATQIVREGTIAAPQTWTEREARTKEKLQSAIAWNLATAAFYKSGARPWKLATVRPGVCYLGVVFKEDTNSPDPRNACCAAQMFLDSGDGVVFKGAVGPWYNDERGDFHLSEDAACELIGLAVSSYRRKMNEEPPMEVFIHGRVRFSDDEWRGFVKGAGAETKVVGVRIIDGERLKLFTRTNIPLLRGMAWAVDDRTAYLWSRGFVPRLRTYPGLEVPTPLYVQVCRGEAAIETVLADILSLTKLNYNSCIYADGVPVTLKFADAVGEILTAGPIEGVPPLPFKHYI